jgi:type VI secretion system protein VasI
MAAIVGTANAAEREEIAKCAAHKASAERLVCFDSLAKSIGVDKPTTTVTAGKGKWLVRSDKSPINDSTNVFLSLNAEQAVRSGYKTVTPTLIIRCSEGKTNVYITWDLYLGLESTTMLTRLDKEAAVSKTWAISTDNKAVFVSGSDVAFAKSLMAHQSLLAQITPYGESPVMTTFDVGGLTEAVKPLREACKW